MALGGEEQPVAPTAIQAIVSKSLDFGNNDSSFIGTYFVQAPSPLAALGIGVHAPVGHAWAASQ
jgi:hypothetical protein